MMKTADVVQTQGEAGGLRQPLTPPSNYLVLPTTKVGRNRCISCSDSTYPSNYEDPNLLLNVQTRHIRTPSISNQIQDDYKTGSIVYFCRSRGHGFISPEHNFISPNKTNNNENSSGNGEDIFVHISDIDSDYVPRKGDRVSYKLCPFPPKFEKYQAVNVRITSLSPQPHNRWDTPQKPDEQDSEPGRLPAVGEV